MILSPLGDSAVVVTLGSAIDEATSARVRTLSAALERETAAGIVDIVPAYTTVTVVYEPGAGNVGDEPGYERICRAIKVCAEKADGGWPGRVAANLPGKGGAMVEIPVCYGGEFGPDLGAVAQHCGLNEADVQSSHAGGEYVVHAVGFTPGFPYLGGLPAKLRTPRRASPRPSVPAGSVGIGWTQTGIYPLASPGGWQLIGRTPLALFQPERNPAALLRVGDRVKFRAISAEEFAAWK